MLLADGLSNDDMLMAAGGAAALVGAGALVAVAFGVLRRIRSTPRGPHLKHLWRPPEEGEAPPPATEHEIAAVERKLGRQLPRFYKRMLAIQNGGDLRYSIWASSDPTGKQLAFFRMYTLSGVGPDDSLARTPDMIRRGLLPNGLACLLDDQEWDLCLDYRGRKTGEEPSVVALDEERTEYVLADTMEQFVAGFCRDLRCHVYAAQGAVGPHGDNQVMALNAALGVQLAPTDAKGSEYRAAHPAWRSPATRPAPAELRLVRNGCDRDHDFPETWSKWVLCCDIAPAHRDELEARLRKTEFRWVLLHAPPRRLLEGGFFGDVEPVGLG